MKMIKNARENPFFLTVGFLFVFAILHLGIQIWGSPSQRSSAMALEAPPGVPPKISSPTSQPDPEIDSDASPVDDPADGVAESSDPAATPVQPEPKAPPVAPEPATLATATPASSPSKLKLQPAPTQAVPLKTASPKKEVLKEEKKKAPDPAKAAVAAPASVTVVKADPLKAPKKARKKAVKAMPEPQTPEYQIPQEWNWFSKPMTMVFNGSEWVLATEQPADTTTDEASPSRAEERGSDPDLDGTSLEHALAVEETPVDSPDKAVGSISPDKNLNTTSPAAVVATLAPEKASIKSDVVAMPVFERALAKMASRKAKRLAEAERLQVTLPSCGGANTMVPDSLIKMIDALGKIGSSGDSLDAPTSKDAEGLSAGQKGAALAPMAPVAGSEPLPGVGQ